MSITTTLTWTRYDGTPETLPEEGKPCIVCADEGGSFNMGHAQYTKDGWWVFYDFDVPARVDDLWAPWPVAPEVE